MHFTFVLEHWWAVLGGMALVLAVFVLVAGRGAEGGLRGRAGQGWSKWRALSRKAGELQARIVLTVFYFTLAAPFGLARTYLADPLRMKPGKQGRAWLARATRDRTLDDARRQF
jgi:hypothetical protein